RLYCLATLSRTCSIVFFLLDTPARPDIYSLSLHDALPICRHMRGSSRRGRRAVPCRRHRLVDDCLSTDFRRRKSVDKQSSTKRRSEEHTSELQSPDHLVCRLLLEKKKKIQQRHDNYLNTQL